MMGKRACILGGCPDPGKGLQLKCCLAQRAGESALKLELP